MTFETTEDYEATLYDFGGQPYLYTIPKGTTAETERGIETRFANGGETVRGIQITLPKVGGVFVPEPYWQSVPTYAQSVVGVPVWMWGVGVVAVVAWFYFKKRKRK
jgi:hypothetical protein